MKKEEGNEGTKNENWEFRSMNRLFPFPTPSVAPSPPPLLDFLNDDDVDARRDTFPVLATLAAFLFLFTQLLI
ncbi:hypothetical protein F5877DRAFT_86337 [Lentinula edodes]|nr:hypothetical protein F5877DRAFT_86337 [Lentinula edodes]